MSYFVISFGIPIMALVTVRWYLSFFCKLIAHVGANCTDDSVLLAKRFANLGIVKVAYVVAALDGEISDTERKALGALMKKCRGYSKKAADKALEEAMRSAGYVVSAKNVTPLESVPHF